MEMRRQMNPMNMAALAAVVLLLITSCDKEPVDLRPELPPMKTMMMDFSDFSEQPATSKGSATTYQNFLRSYLTVGFWNVSVTLVSALPLAAYIYALEQTPVYLGENTWEWSYEFSLNNVGYAATLSAMRINNEEFTVEMVIAFSALPGNGVKWFDGVVRYDHTSAGWTFYKEGTIPVLEIAWNKDYESEAAGLTYTYTEQGQKENGSYIQWEYIPGGVYDAAYTVSMADGTTYIEWSTTTVEGRIKDHVFFGDDLWHCWDSYANGLADRVCNE
ncbi:MAG: hypothetical protein R6W31_12210 [Bacteroidales bacterium]